MMTAIAHVWVEPHSLKPLGQRLKSETETRYREANTLDLIGHDYALYGESVGSWPTDSHRWIELNQRNTDQVSIGLYLLLSLLGRQWCAILGNRLGTTENGVVIDLLLRPVPGQVKEIMVNHLVPISHSLPRWFHIGIADHQQFVHHQLFGDF
jgi:hypothetical protein